MFASYIKSRRCGGKSVGNYTTNGWLISSLFSGDQKRHFCFFTHLSSLFSHFLSSPKKDDQRAWNEKMVLSDLDHGHPKSFKYLVSKWWNFSNFPTFQCWWAVIWGTPCSPRPEIFIGWTTNFWDVLKKAWGNLGFFQRICEFFGEVFMVIIWCRRIFCSNSLVQKGFWQTVWAWVGIGYIVPVQKPQDENMLLNQSEDSFATAVRKHSASRLQPKYNLKTSQKEITRHLAIPANKDHCSKETPRIWNWLPQESPGPTVEFENFAGSHSRLSIRLRCRCYGASWTAPSTTHLCCTYRGMSSQSFLFFFRSSKCSKFPTNWDMFQKNHG